MSFQLTPHRGKTKPFYDADRLWRYGFRINNKTAWRIVGKGLYQKYAPTWRHGRSRQRHFKYPLSQRWIKFGKDQVVLRDENGNEKAYNRAWEMPFLATVWAANRFDVDNTVRWLRVHGRLKCAHGFARNLLLWGITKHWEEVKDYMAKRFDIDLTAIVKRHDEVIKWAEQKKDVFEKPGEQLEAASLAERGLGRLMSIVAEMDKKEQEKEEASAVQKQFLEKLESIEQNTET